MVGFRGIGRQARLHLYPAPGLMVVSGRNGSGKSSFAEALELALTGTSYRWHKKETLWAESWQNLHHPDQCAVRVGFTAEGAGPFTVGVNWAPGAALTERASWTQAGSEKRVDGTDHLGWARPLELSRPVLSYDELVGSSTAGRRLSMTRWPSCSASKCWPTPRNGLPPN